jgi:AhpD family alkylhydroperoxidase
MRQKANLDKQKRVKALLGRMKKERGYLQAAWTYLAEKDVDFMEAYDNLYNRGLKAGKALPVKTRELIAIAVLAFRGNEHGVHEHIKRALNHGASKQEILEAIETSIIPGGAPTLGAGLRALMRIEEEEKKGKGK